jgi:hypothetical protein
MDPPSSFSALPRPCGDLRHPRQRARLAQHLDISKPTSSPANHPRIGRQRASTTTIQSIRRTQDHRRRTPPARHAELNNGKTRRRHEPGRESPRSAIRFDLPRKHGTTAFSRVPSRSLRCAIARRPACQHARSAPQRPLNLVLQRGNAGLTICMAACLENHAFEWHQTS